MNATSGSVVRSFYISGSFVVCHYAKTTTANEVREDAKDADSGT